MNAIPAATLAHDSRSRLNVLHRAAPVAVTAIQNPDVEISTTGLTNPAQRLTAHRHLSGDLSQSIFSLAPAPNPCAGQRMDTCTARQATCFKIPHEPNADPNPDVETSTTGPTDPTQRLTARRHQSGDLSQTTNFFPPGRTRCAFNSLRNPPLLNEPAGAPCNARYSALFNQPRLITEARATSARAASRDQDAGRAARNQTAAGSTGYLSQSIFSLAPAPTPPAPASRHAWVLVRRDKPPCFNMPQGDDQRRTAPTFRSGRTSCVARLFPKPVVHDSDVRVDRRPLQPACAAVDLHFAHLRI
ncbi:hypothetical protein P3T23_009480 [Paraburkholderia sp. GAS448]